MKKLLSILILLIFFVGAATAQRNKQERNERIEAMRVAFITEKLELTVEESQLFWPIFNEYEAERKKTQRSFDRKRDIEAMTDAEAELFVSQSFVKDQQMLDLKRTYFEKFRIAIPVKKIARLSRVEKNFRQELIKRMRQGREGQGRPERKG
ncbi:MAG: hypothetical protein ACI85O_002836 [Saprospiraceae bacterium]|jgi:hypothetical protein